MSERSEGTPHGEARAGDVRRRSRHVDVYGPPRPLGAYSLGEPRASVPYGIFVPVDYPTPEQRRAGFTGGAIGVHGPDRRVRWAGVFVNLFDTTDGCVGIATDDEMSRIAAWVRARKVRAIVVK